ncbi:MAG: beta-1,4-galactosyltransferase [Candidatus Omnitrophica bacterium]|nr:beta-1,4-galactosyltransferase [Candidatus Omnitrophota bacterium]
MIFITVGGGPFYGFNRLIEEIDRIAPALKEDVVVQKGCSTYEPKNLTSFRFLSFNTSVSYFKKANVVVGHAGAGTILLSRMLNKPFVAVPRSHEKKEIFDAHQLETAKRIESKEMVEVVYDIADTENAIRKSLLKINKTWPPSEGRQAAVKTIRNFLKKEKENK